MRVSVHETGVRMWCSQAPDLLDIYPSQHVIWEAKLGPTELHCPCNRPLSYSLHPLFQGECKCEAIEIRISVFIHIKIKINYHNKDFALRLALKKRLGGTRKWSIAFVLIVSIQRFDWLTVFAGPGSSGLNPLLVDGEVNCNSVFHYGERIQFLVLSSRGVSRESRETTRSAMMK